MRNKTTTTTSVRSTAWLGTLFATALVAAVLATLSQSSHAQDQPPQTPPPPPVQGGQSAPPGAANFAQHQQKELDHIAARMQILQTLQSCVQGATNHAALKTCNETAKQSEQQLHH